jgi:hypothetical protein
MFPDNVERLVLDGVVDAPNYYATLWSKNLLQVYQSTRLISEVLT